VTVRKPAGMGWESFVERQIREAQERGEFDDLRGKGEPIADLHQPYDELWWVRRKMQREGLSLVPPALALRREHERTRERISRARSEREVRHLVERLNARIVEVNAAVTDGPSSNLVPLEVERVVADWRDRRDGDAAAREDQGR
jgi:hypothetical protein